MNAYVFQAALLCEPCAHSALMGIAKMQRLDTPELRTLSTSTLCIRLHRAAGLEVGRMTDTDKIPEGPHSNGGGEADSPQHCDHCGLFLENPLTNDGRQYVAEALAESYANGRGRIETLREWLEFYCESYQ